MPVWASHGVMYLVFTRVPGELPWAILVFVLVFMKPHSSADDLPLFLDS